jgi:hypothetical protein
LLDGVRRFIHENGFGPVNDDFAEKSPPQIPAIPANPSLENLTIAGGGERYIVEFFGVTYTDATFSH